MKSLFARFLLATLLMGCTTTDGDVPTEADATEVTSTPSNEPDAAALIDSVDDVASTPEPVEVTVTEEEGLTTFSDGHISLLIDRARGTFDVSIDGVRYLRQATSAIELGSVSLTEVDTMLYPAAALDASGALRPLTYGEEDDGFEIRLVHPGFPWGELTTTFRILPYRGGLAVSVALTSIGIDDLVGLIPVFVGPEESVEGSTPGLFFQSDPSHLLILQNGVDIGVDYYVDLLPGDTAYRQGFMDTALESIPSSASNWNALVYDRANAEGLLFGYLSFERVVPQVVIGYEPEAAPTQGDVTGYARFHARCSYVVARQELLGRTVTSETFWFDRFEGRPQGALERYAQMIAERYPPPAYKGEKAGWDSWYIYSNEINEEIIQMNLAGLVEHFADYGLTTLEVDLGWEMNWGVWSQNPHGFPNGMDAMAEQIASAGLEPDIWMGSTNAMSNTPLLEEHPEWVAEIEPIMHVLLQPGSVPLDLTRDDVIDFVAWTGELLRSWGYVACKFDFAYYWMFATSLQDPAQTVVESYRRAMKAFRTGFGEDNYLINILLMGTNYGEVDAMRIGIDSRACWGQEEGEDCEAANNTTGFSGEGIRYGVKTLARRYYYNNVVWKNHPDQIFFRDYPSFEAQRSWGTVIALSGAYISLGEEVPSMTQQEIDTFRRFLPTMDISGVPQDLFERDYPEVWLTPLDTKALGGAVLSLYSWGTNKDLTQNPFTPMPEETRQHTVDLADHGLTGTYHAFEFWTDTDLGVVTEGQLVVDVPARDSRVVVLRPHEARPYILTSNRHVSQGATDITDVAWSAETQTLSWTQQVVAGFDHRVRVDPSAQASTPTLSLTGEAEGIVQLDGALWSVDIEATSTGAVTVSLSFP